MCIKCTLDNVYETQYNHNIERWYSMPIDYTKLFELMKEKGLTTYRIRKEKIISEGTLQKLRENKAVSTESISALCKALGCQPGDIIEYVPEEQTEE